MKGQVTVVQLDALERSSILLPHLDFSQFPPIFLSPRARVDRCRRRTPVQATRSQPPNQVAKVALGPATTRPSTTPQRWTDRSRTRCPTAPPKRQRLGSVLDGYHHVAGPARMTFSACTTSGSRPSRPPSTSSWPACRPRSRTTDGPLRQGSGPARHPYRLGRQTPPQPGPDRPRHRASSATRRTTAAGPGRPPRPPPPAPPRAGTGPP